MKSNNFCVIGHPLGHTMSPFIHSKLFELSGKSAEYSARDIEPDTLGEAFDELKNLVGFNVTIPFKQQII
ncbi:MAG: shikimate dehydrogenase, partial [Clostridia bacterium]|nr:shikimate dehydrogenase [Clostridia bacterium]